MPAIETLIANLSAFPACTMARLGNRLEVKTADPDGFPVSLVEAPGRFFVNLGHCRWRFAEEKEAVDHVLFGLSDRCRLREFTRGKPYRWVIEQITDTGWRAMNETGLILFPFWKRREERIYRNTGITW